jgi:hypothetical protein
VAVHSDFMNVERISKVDGLWRRAAGKQSGAIHDRQIPTPEYTGSQKNMQ